VWLKAQIRSAARITPSSAPPTWQHDSAGKEALHLLTQPPDADATWTTELLRRQLVRLAGRSAEEQS
jgi:hypothetical protein